MSRRTREDVKEDFIDAIRAYQTATDQLDDTVSRLLGISRTDARCLDIVDRLGPLTAGELARRAGLTTGAITGVVDRMEAKGFLTRVRDEHDRRKVLISYTDEGRRKGYELYTGMGEEGEEELSRYTVAELEVVIDVLRRSTDLTERHAERLRGRLAGQ